MAAAILLIGIVSGTVGAVSVSMLLPASFATAVLAYFVFGALGATAATAAVWSRITSEDNYDPEADQNGFHSSTVSMSHR